MSVRFLFIRHGYSEANRGGFLAGWTDAALTEQGLRQAKTAAEFVKENYSVDAVYASDLQRAWKTAGAVAAPFGLSVNRDPRLREIYGGDWEAMDYHEIGRRYPDDFAAWQKDMSSVYPPNGENVREVQQRALAAVGEIAKANDGKTVVIVTHRCVLRSLQCLWENRPITQINECAWLSNCSVSEVRYDGGKLTPVCIGQDSFMGDDVTVVSTAM